MSCSICSRLDDPRCTDPSQADYEEQDLMTAKLLFGIRSKAPVKMTNSYVMSIPFLLAESFKWLNLDQQISYQNCRALVEAGRAISLS
ncbi:hypothetical protein Plhal304r1_c052g0136831 [Plasmopara halstedii]